MKWNYITAILLFTILSCHAYAQEVTVLEMDKPKHVGVKNLTAWEEGWMTEGPYLTRGFYVEGPIRRIWIDMLVYSVGYKDNPVWVNNRTIGYFCRAPEAWTPCNITINPSAINLYDNEVAFWSAWHLMNNQYDDLMFKKLKLNVEYVHLEPKVVSSKTQSAYLARLGEPVNVSIDLTNIGARPAFNITAEDIRLQDAVITAGSMTFRFSPLRGGDAVRYQYTITPLKKGDYVSWPGRLKYHDLNGTVHTSTIEPTTLVVKPPIPSIYANKTISKEQIQVGSTAEIVITVTNNGTSPAYNVSIEDTVPNNFTVTLGGKNSTYMVIRGGEGVSLNYTISATNVGLYLASAKVAYEDEEAGRYEEETNKVKVTAVPKTIAGEVKNSAPIVVGAILAVIIVLLLVYMRLRGG